MFDDAINSSPLLSSFKALGGIKADKLYRAFTTVGNMDLTKRTKLSLDVAKALQHVSAHQNTAIRDYFTTPNANPQDMQVSPDLTEMLVKAKEQINDNAKEAYTSGLISQQAYLKNKDMYLHTAYLKYLDTYRGSSKRTSLMNFLKSKSKLTEEEELRLGKIQDVRFLIPETLGIVSRDLILLNMFENISKASSIGNYNWALTTTEKIQYPGDRNKSLTIHEAYNQIERNEEVLSYIDASKHKTFGTENMTLQEIQKFREDTSKLKESLTELEGRLLDSAVSQATGRSDMSSEEKQEFLKKFYVKLPDNKRMGELRGRFVRKEIANDLDAFSNAFDISRHGFIESVFANGGLADRGTSLWKFLLIAGNPGSWFRNTAGNFSLLTLHTDTPSIALGASTMSELIDAGSGRPSIYWRIFSDMGGFGNTLSSTELQAFFKEHGNSLKADFAKSSRTANNPLDNYLTALDPNIFSITKALHAFQSKLSNGHSLVEGLFKVVSMKDYIKRWEKQQGLKHEVLTPEEKVILYTKAVDHANKAVFDYSRVNSAVKFMRGSSTPFGVPFITFTYKAAGASMYAALNHPVKLAAMLATPTLIGILGSLMGGLDDEENDTVKRSLPKYKRDSFGTTVIPWKDSRGITSTIDMSYLIPSAQYLTAGHELANGFTDPSESVGQSALKSLKTLGFLGSPVISTAAKLISGEDSFGRKIITPGASSMQHLWETVHAVQDTILPGWLRSQGWVRDMFDEFASDTPDTNSFGELKRSPTETVLGVTGMEFQSANVRQGLSNRGKEYQRTLRELSVFRSQVINDRTDKFNKASELRGIAEREKLIRLEMATQLKNNTSLK